MRKQLQNIVVAIALLSLSLVIGIGGFMMIEDYSLVNAFYMSVITISTVGFTEVHELSNGGRLFTSFYIMVNLAIFAYVVSVLTTYFVEGKLRTVFRSYMTDREISRLSNHVIVCGHGRNGSQACEELIHDGRKIVVIENNPEARQNIPDNVDLHVLAGDASEDHVLRMAAIERAKEIIITTPSDADNVFITLTARELKPDINIISRASERETESKLYRAGANRVIMPDYLGGMFMAQIVTKPVVIDFLDLLTGRSRDVEKYKLESITYEDLKPKYRDQSLGELQIKTMTGATVIAVKDNIKGLIPNPPADTVVSRGDTMIILCSESSTRKIFNSLTGH